MTSDNITYFSCLSLSFILHFPNYRDTRVFLLKEGNIIFKPVCPIVMVSLKESENCSKGAGEEGEGGQQSH